ncbi:MAG: PilT/PilU family type 4a pilus ATPase [Candidatus Eremiobacteraeota bacterium]|nr:PilT/PilU family type 4a pilus ATPase [Candidatus Eremiobacteraeota bacterium]
MKSNPEKHKKDINVEFRSFLAALSGEAAPASIPTGKTKRQAHRSVTKRPTETKKAPPPDMLIADEATSLIDNEIPQAQPTSILGVKKNKSGKKTADITPDTGDLEQDSPVSSTSERITLSHVSVRAQFTIEQLLETMIRENASDLHLATNAVPALRINGEINRLQLPDLDLEMSEELLFPFLTEEQKELFEEEGDFDFSFDYMGKGRFRVNYFRHHRGIGALFRYIPIEIPTLESLGLPRVVNNLIRFKKGLILVAGPAGNGKTTTIASMINEINRTQKKRIITLESPIEYVYKNNKSLISQREIGTNVISYSDALWAVLREDPDIIMLGELWETDDIKQVLKISETGHLVIASMQTIDCTNAIERLVHAFPAEEKEQIRIMVAESLVGVIAQQLIPKDDGMGRVLAAEILLATTGLTTIIREGKFNQIPSIIQTGGKLGMTSLDQAIMTLVERRVISKEMASNYIHIESPLHIENPY